MLALDAVLDLEVHASGFLVAEVQDVRSDRALTLSAGLPVQVRLPLSFDPPADVTLLVALVPERLLPSPGWRAEEILGADGTLVEFWYEGTSDLYRPLVDHREIRLGLPEPGRYAVRWKVESLDGRYDVSLRARNGAEIEVGPAGLDAVLELRPDHAALADAKRRIERR